MNNTPNLTASNVIPTYGSGAAAAGYSSQPDQAHYDAGVRPLDSLPAEWWNWLWTKISSNMGAAQQDFNVVYTELVSVLTAAGITPSSQASDQVKQAILKLAQAYASTTTPGAIKSGTGAGEVSVNSTTGIATVNCMGDLSTLDTTATTIVDAINEVYAAITPLSSTAPLVDAATASAGTSACAARADHVHPMPWCDCENIIIGKSSYSFERGVVVGAYSHTNDCCGATLGYCSSANRLGSALGYVACASITAVAVGACSKTGIGAIAIGAFANACGNCSIAIGNQGRGCCVDSQNAIAIGYQAYVRTSLGAIAIGYGTYASCSTYGIALGASSYVCNPYTIAMGCRATATECEAIAIGHDATAYKGNAIAIGTCTIGAYQSIAIGLSAKAFDDRTEDSIAIGTLAYADCYGIALGRNTETYHGIAIGCCARSTLPASSAPVALGKCAVTSAVGGPNASPATCTPVCVVGSIVMGNTNMITLEWADMASTRDLYCAISDQIDITMAGNSCNTGPNTNSIRFGVIGQMRVNISGQGDRNCAISSLVIDNSDTTPTLRFKYDSCIEGPVLGCSTTCYICGGRMTLIGYWKDPSL